MSIKNSITNYLLLKIQQGDFLVGDKLPSEQALAIKFNCNRHTARSALTPLLNTGVIEMVPGKGNILKYSLMQLYTNNINIKHNSLKIIPIDFEELPIGMLKHYQPNSPCFKEIYYFNTKIIAYSYVILTNKMINEVSYLSLFNLFSYYGIVIKQVSNNLKLITNHGRYLEINQNFLIKSEYLFYSNNEKIEAIVTLIANPYFFQAQSFSNIF